jgi:hypothetical protein
LQSPDDVKEAFELFDRAGSGASWQSPPPRGSGTHSLVNTLLSWLAVSHAAVASPPLPASPVAPRAGKISFEDFGTVVRAVGLNPSEKELEGAGSGEKDLGAVQAFVKQLDESKPSKSDVESKVSRLHACAPPRSAPRSPPLSGCDICIVP